MAWSEKYKHGVIWQDFQHERLINRIEEMADSINSTVDVKEFLKTIALVDRYIEEHFSLEEHYMTLYQYPQLSNHKQEHKKFINDYLAFRSHCKTKGVVESKQLLLKLSKWVAQHIMKEDKNLADFLNRKENPDLLS